MFLDNLDNKITFPQAPVDISALQNTLSDDARWLASEMSQSLNLQSLMAEPEHSHPVVEAPGSSSSIFKYKDYGNVQKTMDYYWDMGDNFHNGVINIDNYPIRIRLLCYGLS